MKIIRFSATVLAGIGRLQGKDTAVLAVLACLCCLPLADAADAAAPHGILSGRNTLIVASSDMTHFENAQLARKLDDLALEKVLALDAAGLHSTVMRHRISMCGFAPSVAMITAAVELGATAAELVRYGHSGEQTGDDSSVVGYAAVRVY